MTEAELKARESKLTQDRKAWVNQKESLKREVVKAHGQLDVVLEKIASKNTAHNSLVDKITEAEGKLQAKNQQIAKLDKAIESKESEYQKRMSELQAVDALIADRKHNADLEVKTYEQGLKNDVKSRLEALSGKLEGLKTEAKVATTERDQAKVELGQLKTEILQKEQEARDLQIGIDGEIEGLKSKLDSAKAESAKADKELSELKDTINIAKQELDKVHLEHDKLVRYEKKAWAALNAKDEELQSRESTVRQDEVLLKNRRSYLPEMK